MKKMQPLHSVATVVAGLLILLGASHGWAGTVTWTGADTLNSNAWSSASNWSPTGVPGAGDDVAFTATAVGGVDLGGAERAVNSVKFSHSSGTYTVTNGALRCLSGTADSFWVSNNGTVVMRVPLGLTGDAHGVKKGGSGYLTFSAANPYAGGTAISDGTIELQAQDALGSGTFQWLTAGKYLKTTGPAQTLTNALTSAGGTVGMALQVDAITTFAGPLSVPNNTSPSAFKTGAIAIFRGPVTLASTGTSFIEFHGTGTSDKLVLWEPSVFTQSTSVNNRMQLTTGSTLAIKKASDLFNGMLYLNSGTLLLDGVSWSDFLADRSGGYGGTSAANSRNWLVGSAPGFAARTTDVVIGTPGEDLSYVFNRNFQLGASAKGIDGQFYANADITVRANIAMTSNLTITAAGFGPGTDRLQPQHSFSVLAGSLSGSGVYPTFVSAKTGTQYQNNLVGEMVLRGSCTWTGSPSRFYWTNATTNYWFSAGPGGMLSPNGHSLVRFDGNASLPAGNGGVTAYLGAFHNASGGTSLSHGYLLTTKPAGETYQLPTGYKFVFGGMGNRSTQNLFGAASHDGTPGTATLQNSDVCHHGLITAVLAGSAGFDDLGVFAREGTFVLGTTAGGPVRFIPVQSAETATSSSATTLSNDLRVHSFVKRGEGTVVLGNVSYTTLSYASNTSTNFKWTVGRGAASGTPANAGAGTFFDGAVRGRSTSADDSTATLANSLFASASSFNLRLAGGVYEVDANGAVPRTFAAALGTGSGQVMWVGGSGSTGVASGGGFSAYGGPLTVDIGGGTSTSQEWQQSNFVAVNAPLMFGSYTATHDVTWNDPLGLANADNATVERDVRVIAKAVEFSGGIRNRGAGTAGGTGTRSLVKTGAGTLRFVSGATYDYNGTTAVQEGTLEVNANWSAVGGSVTVSGTGKLGGTGTVTRDVILQGGGAMSPGASAGSLTLANVTVGEGGAYDWQFLSDAAGQSDKAIVTGALTFTGPWTVRLAQLGAATPGQSRYVLFDVTGSIVGFDPQQVTVDASGTAWPDAYVVGRVANQIVLKRSTEPATLILVR